MKVLRSGLVGGYFLFLWLGTSRGAPTVALGQNFTGSTYSIDSPYVPPDCNGAAGPSHFVEFINGRFSVYSKATGARVQTLTDASFWSRAGFVLPAGWGLSDPRTVYDPTVQRWFTVQIDLDPTGTVNTDDFLLAVSATADPTGAWTAMVIPSDPGGNTFADFPTLGLDAQGLILAGDMFDPSGGAIGSTVVSIPKAGLLAAVPTVAGQTWFGIMSYASHGHILQPAISLDGTAGNSVLATGSLGVNFTTGQLQTNTTLIGFDVQNESGPGSATLSAPSVITVPGYTAPLNPTQPDGSNRLDDGDARFGAGVRRVNGVLFAVQATQLNDLAAVRWYRINAANYSLLEAGTISDPGLNLFYPSIAANTDGTIVIACNGTSPGTYISGYAVVGQTVGGTTTFGPLLLLKSGAASYHVAGSTSISRWGDYTATSVDPVDPSRFWTILAYPSSATAWSTQITEIITSSTLPTLTIAKQDGAVLVSWPLAASASQLQSAPTLSPNHIWSAVSQTPSTNGGLVSVSLPASAGQQYFRLQQAPGVFMP